MSTTDIWGADYANGVIPFFHKDSNGNIVSKEVADGTYTIKNSVIVLEEYPDLQYGFTVELLGKENNKTLSRVEKNYLSLTEDEYTIDVVTGYIHFHPILEGRHVKVSNYYGKGLWLITDKRIIADIDKEKDGSFNYISLADTIANAKGFISKGEWKNNIKYGTNNIVVSNGVIYRAKKENTGKFPKDNKDCWEVVIDVNSIISEHAGIKATGEQLGHVKLSDTINDAFNTSAGVAATPKAVYIHAQTVPEDGHLGHVHLSDSPTGVAEYTAASSHCANLIHQNIENHKADTNNPHSVTAAQVGLGNVDNTSDLDKPISTATQTALDKKADKQTAKGGFEAGDNASARYGAAIGCEAHTTEGGAVGYEAEASTGGAIGCDAYASSGGAVGCDAYASSGGAVGRSAYAGKGFSGGYSAKVLEVSYDEYIDAIQLGTGTNENEKTLQVYDYTLMDADGTITSERLKNAHTSITGGASTIASSNLTANRALISNSSGKVAVSDITNTELGYLDGVTGNIQAQLNTINTKLPSTTITTAKNFNDLKTTGIYHINVHDCTNTPVQSWGTLYVDFSVGTPYQIYVPDGDSAEMYKRSYINSVWSEWKMIVPNANIKKNPSAAGGDIIDAHLTVGTRGTGAIGTNSFTSGYTNTASGYGSAVLGGGANMATGSESVILGGNYNSTSNSYSAVLGGTSNKANEEDSVVVGGCSNTANSMESVVIGGSSNKVDTYSNYSAILGGHNNLIIGYPDDEYYAYNCAIIGGNDNRIDTDANGAVILGGKNNNITNSSTAQSSAIIGGYYAIAYDFNTVVGRYNINPDNGWISGTNGDVFTVGIGTSSARKNGFRVNYAGNCYAAASMNSTGADYAECFEWVDKNPDNEDRVGYMTAFEGDKIRLASENDPIEIQGVVSALPAVVGDNYADEWHGKYLKDKYGRLLTEHKVYEAEYRDVEVDEEVELTADDITAIQEEITNDETLTDDEKEIKLSEIPTTKTVKVTKRVLEREAYEADEYILNPDYNADEEYIPRLNRKEYSAVGTHGKLAVRDDGSCVVGGFCKSGDGGIATASESGFYVMERIDEETVRIYIK